MAAKMKVLRRNAVTLEQNEFNNLLWFYYSVVTAYKKGEKENLGSEHLYMSEKN